MLITTTHSGRAAEVRAKSTPEPGRHPLRYGSVVAQLENDQFNDDECAPGAGRDPIDSAWGRGWNAAVRQVLVAVRSGRAFSTYAMPETGGGEPSRAFARGHNAGLRHALDVIRRDQRDRMDGALRELAYAPVIRTIDLGDAR